MANLKSIPSKVWGFLTGHKVISIMVLVVLVAVIWIWRSAAGKTTGTPVTYTVKTGDVSQSVSASGNIVPVQEVTLTFKSQGTVQALNIQMGDQVKAGQVLAQEDSKDLQAQLDQAQATLNSANANYNQAVANRSNSVIKDQVALDQAQAALTQASDTLNIAQAAYNTTPSPDNQGKLSSAKSAYQSAPGAYQVAKSNLDVALGNYSLTSSAATVKSAQSQLTTAQNNLNNVQLTAPFDGYIVQVNGAVGASTGSSGSASTLSSASGGSTGSASASGSSSSSGSGFSIVVSSTNLQLSAEINEADISKVQVGQSVAFTVDTYPNKTFTGKLASLSPEAAAVSNVQMYKAIISIDDYSQLKSGLPATISIITNTAQGVTYVPLEAFDFARTYLASVGSTRTGRTGNSTGGNIGSQGFSGAAIQNHNMVVVMKNGKETRKIVTTGISDDSNTEIKSGLAAGDVVVLSDPTLKTSSTTSSSSSSSGLGSMMRGNNSSNTRTSGSSNSTGGSGSTRTDSGN
jgi:HlyD family secretion protein